MSNCHLVAGRSLIDLTTSRLFENIKRLELEVAQLRAISCTISRIAGTWVTR
jgi:hypothetical protein